MNRLTQEEISFFKREGYLFKRGVMDPELMARARERLWKGAPPRMKRDDPSTWMGPFRADEEDEGPGNRRIGYMWKYCEPRSEEWIVRMSAADPTILGWTEQLLGEGEVELPERIRGIYCRLPMSEEPEEPIGCHCDAFAPDKLDTETVIRLMAPRVGFVGLIAPIPPSGGAFTVWPGTHRIVYDIFSNFEGRERIEVYKEQIIKFRDRPRVESHGEAGDIFFWHNLLSHSAGRNRSEQIQLREAVLADYDRKKNKELEGQRPHEDMWHEWSKETRSAPPGICPT